MIRIANALMEKDTAKNDTNNPKIFWKYAKSIRKTKSGIGVKIQAWK